MAVLDLLHVARLGTPRDRTAVVRQLLTILAGLSMVALADPRPVTFQIGAVITALGWCIRIWSFGHLRKNKALITSGPYRYSRHPAYFGSLVCLIGVGLAAGNAVNLRGQLVWSFLALLLVVFFGFYLPRKFDREGKRLHELFGADMQRWCDNVPRFLPQLRPWADGGTERFSLDNLMKNHEWPWGVVMALVFVGIHTAEHWSPFL